MSFHAQRFGRAAATYGSHAGVQEGMADALLGLMPEADIASILEMGCGTGNFTRRLKARFPKAALWATDASPPMIASARENLGEAGEAGSGIAWSEEKLQRLERI